MISPLERLGGDAVRAAIRDGAVVCTATQRLARSCRRAWDDHMREEGHEAWRAPRILPFSTWMHAFVEEALLYHQYNPGTAAADGKGLMLLSAQQEQLSWESALQEGGDAGAVLQPDMLAGLLREAHEIEHAWLLPESRLQRQTGQGSAMYLRTRERVRDIWRSRGQIPASQLPRLALDAARRHPELLPHAVVFLGFDLLPDAAFKATVDTFRNTGKSVLTAQTPAASIPAEILRYADFSEELTAAALWARELLDRGESDICIVVPGLERVRSVVEQRFSDILSPVTVMHSHDAETGLFELSLGPRCIAEPVISAALTGLDILRPRIPVAAASRVLRSPFFSPSPENRHARLEMDLQLHALGVEELSPQTLREFLQRTMQDDEDPLPQVMRTMEIPGGSRGARDWAVQVQNALNALGWPGDRRLNSREYQAVRRWNGLLQEFAAYEAVLSPMGFSEALGRLRRLAAERVFQPEAHDAPVQIMGMLETAGLRFAHCRVIGLTEEQWPPPARSNPFISLALQRDAGVTEVLPERYLEQMRGVIERLSASAPDLVFTCSAMEGDRELLPSPLLGDVHLIPSSAADAGYARRIQREWPEATERYTDSGGPPLTAQETVRGGARIMTLQSACPFRAFASVRLGADEPETAEAGLRPLDRGNLLHEALHRFWSDVGSADALRVMDDDALRTRLGRHLRAAEQATGDLRTRQLPQHVRDAEHACALTVLEEWCALERERGSFRVEATESTREATVGALSLRLRIDRVDALPDGRRLLIDYKTGRHGPGEWMHERPREPQLPLYAVADGSAIGALSYATLRRGECGFAGFRDSVVDEPLLEDIASWLHRQSADPLSWQELLGLWESRLRALADAFAAGDADVDPRDGEDTCSTCNLHALCRIDELRREGSRV